MPILFRFTPNRNPPGFALVMQGRGCASGLDPQNLNEYALRGKRKAGKNIDCCAFS